jgi:restriction system protein
MAGIPDYQTLMLPVLQTFADGKEHSTQSTIEAIANQLNLSQAEREELLPSGNKTILNSRVGWAKTYLVKAMLLDSPRRAVFRITERGKQVLAENLIQIDNEFLKRFEQFNTFLKHEANEYTRTNDIIPQELNFISREDGKEISFSAEPPTHSQTPTERIDTVYSEIRSALSQEVLDRVLELTPARFERLVVELLVTMGYGGALPDAGSMTKLSGDEGIDGIIKEDKLGLDMIYLQAKRWKDTTVGKPEIQKFVGALAGQKAQKGVFITTSTFSKGAREYTANLQQKVVLIDGEQLAELMIEYNLGVSVAQTYLIKRVDNDYFDENID